MVVFILSVVGDVWFTVDGDIFLTDGDDVYCTGGDVYCTVGDAYCTCGDDVWHFLLQNGTYAIHFIASFLWKSDRVHELYQKTLLCMITYTPLLGFSTLLEKALRVLSVALFHFRLVLTEKYIILATRTMLRFIISLSFFLQNAFHLLKT